MTQISHLAARLTPVIEDINKLLLSYRQEFFQAALEGDRPDEHIQLWVKTVLWPLFANLSSEPDTIQRLILGKAMVDQVRDATIQLFQLISMGEDEVRRISDEVSKELDK